MKVKIFQKNRIKKEIKVPPDKSISHRAVILGCISKGETVIKNFLEADDCLRTVRCFRNMGVKIEKEKNFWRIKSKGFSSLKEPGNILNCGNSGTTMRIISGVLSACSFYSVLTGDRYLRKRPMRRIIVPLEMMGAKIWARENNFPPLSIKGGNLKGITYKLPVASAQVKSSLILAGLFAEGVTKIIEPVKSRDHTERMLKFLEADIEIFESEITVRGGKQIFGKDIFVPSDISSASFFIACGVITKNSEILIKDVGVNPTRCGFLKVLKRMGANIEILNERELNNEPIADILVKSSELKGVNIEGEEIPLLIDEIPVIAVVATQAEGITLIKNAEELRIKETDRIKATVLELKKMGAKIEELRDGMLIEGPVKLKGGKLNSYGDHRMAMALSIAGLVAKGETTVSGCECVKTSFPDFFSILESL
jgi:3-phosphoshikimate 1-carboxyvinyltransferase